MVVVVFIRGGVRVWVGEEEFGPVNDQHMMLREIKQLFHFSYTGPRCDNLLLEVFYLFYQHFI